MKFPRSEFQPQETWALNEILPSRKFNWLMLRKDCGLNILDRPLHGAKARQCRTLLKTRNKRLEVR
ncbi:hypothetical protein RU07_06665 [Agrobacterium tumefaciens]|uniref:Uncharacterized protein n=1 Tax=Agrobacterium tumefaciens TaxID=358 RepID=A0A0D0K5B8_AGRTU|nr:hypothetical protein RU07_06665 [Agrobacterium tumefaciens]